MVFVDIALAQTAALGATGAFLFGWELETWSSYAFTVVTRLVIGWSFGVLVSVIGMVASAALDLPTGATIVCAFGLSLLAFAMGTWLFGLRPRTGAAILAPPDPAGDERLSAVSQTER